MIVVECAQGSDEWKAARAGCITASMFSTIRAKVGMLDAKQATFVAAVRSGRTTAEACNIAGYKATPTAGSVQRAIDGLPVGDWSDKAKDYAFRLAIERISGEPLDEGFETWAMKRGHHLEEDARIEHEAKTGLLVDLAGFVLTEDRKYGASADGLINTDGGCEYKCLISPERLRTILIDGDLSEYKDQIQGCMWITGRSWWHFGLYCPALKNINKAFWMRHIRRDDDYIEAMQADLIEFEKLVRSNEIFLRTEIE